MNASVVPRDQIDFAPNFIQKLYYIHKKLFLVLFLLASLHLCIIHIILPRGNNYYGSMGLCLRFANSSRSRSIHYPYSRRKSFISITTLVIYGRGLEKLTWHMVKIKLVCNIGIVFLKLSIGNHKTTNSIDAKSQPRLDSSFSPQVKLVFQ